MSTDQPLPLEVVAALPAEALQLIPLATLPKATMVVADARFVATVVQVEKQVKTLAVLKTAIEAQSAADLQVRVTDAANEINSTRLALVRPLQDQIDAINNLARPVTARLEAAKASLKTAQTNYANEQARLAKQEQARIDAEIKRLQAIADAEAVQRQKELDRITAEQAELERKQAEAAKHSKVEIIDDDIPEEVIDEPAPTPEKTETERQLEALKYAPAVVAPKPVGVATRKTLTVVVTDVNLLPDMFVDKTARLRAIQSTFCSGWVEGKPLPVLAGCTFEVVSTVVSTGRRGF